MNTRQIPYLFGILVAGVACTADTQYATHVPMVAATDSVLAHDTLTILSTALGEARLINVYVPIQDSVQSANPLPVLYMPDGGLNEDFPHVTHTVDSLIKLGAIRPVIVVGIPNTERRRDLSGPTTVAEDSNMAPRVGGSAVFRRFVKEELFLEIERRYRTAPERGILGESLAGLFIVETFLHDPGMFTHYMALDPSVWWNAGKMIDSAGVRIAAFDTTRRSLFLATSHEPSTAVGSAKLAEVLRAGAPKVRLMHLKRDDLEHSTIFRALEAQALEYAFGRMP